MKSEGRRRLSVNYHTDNREVHLVTLSTASHKSPLDPAPLVIYRSGLLGHFYCLKPGSLTNKL